MGRHDEEYDGDDDERYGDGYVHELHYDAGKKTQRGWRVEKEWWHQDSRF